MPFSCSRLSEAVRSVPDFPQKGIIFRDISPILADGELLRASINALLHTVEGCAIDKVVGIDARGFIFAAPVATSLGCGFIPVRKKGKLPWQTYSMAYSLEYGENCVEIHRDAILPGEKVLLIDDLLATGGTAVATLTLLQKMQADVVAASFLIELCDSKGRNRLDVPVHSILSY